MTPLTFPSLWPQQPIRSHWCYGFPISSICRPRRFTKRNSSFATLCLYSCATCCKQPSCKKIDICFTSFLFDWRERKNWHAYRMRCCASWEQDVGTWTLHWAGTGICLSASMTISLCTHTAAFECAHFVSLMEFKFPMTEAQVHCCCVRGSDPQSWLQFQEPPLEWQKENLHSMFSRPPPTAVTVSVVGALTFI